MTAPRRKCCKQPESEPCIAAGKRGPCSLCTDISKISARMKALHADPEFKAATSARMKALNADRLAWCPRELVEDYRVLARHLGADEARAAITHQARHEKIIAVCPQCEKCVGDPTLRSCTLIGCPLARSETA